MRSDVTPNEINSSRNKPKPVPKDVVPDTVKTGVPQETQHPDNETKTKVTVPKEVVPDTVQNGAAKNTNSSLTQPKPVPKEVVPDMVQNGAAKNTNSSLTQPKPVPKEVVTETVKDGSAKNTNTSNNNPKPSDPGLKPKPDESENVDPTKSLNPSPPAPPTPQHRTRDEWQKSNFLFPLYPT